ncbi:Propionate kinase [Trichinella spiralis]|uniref:Propionate kinase n=1 Tax=Trichinella spiralis TaxID=6334 RepID=A0ABR3KR15_TRISP
MRFVAGDYSTLLLIVIESDISNSCFVVVVVVFKPTVELIEKLLLVEVCLSRRRTKARNSFLTFGRDCSAQSHHLSSPLVDHGQAKSFDTIKLLSTALLLLQTTTVSTVDEFIHQVGGGSKFSKKSFRIN